MQTMERSRTDGRIDELSDRVAETNQRVGWLEGKVDGLDKRTLRLEEKVDGLDQRLGRVEVSVIELNREIHAEFRSIRGEVKFMQATIIGGFVTVLSAMVGLFAIQL